MRSRKPKPTAVRELHGNTRKGAGKPRTHEPIPVGELTEPPEILTDSQREAWNYYVQHTPKGC
jgi:hypothetical protein